MSSTLEDMTVAAVEAILEVDRLKWEAKVEERVVQRDAHIAPCCGHRWDEHGKDDQGYVRCGFIVRSHVRAVDDIEDEPCDCGPYMLDIHDETLWHLAAAARLMERGFLDLPGERQRTLGVLESVYAATEGR